MRLRPIRLLARAGRRARRRIVEEIQFRARHARMRHVWESAWSASDFDPLWRGRGIGRELEAAVAEGWFPGGAPALDVGCGEGDVAAWLAERGFPALGVDIAESAVARARALYGEAPGRLEFRALDVCTQPLPDRRFRVIVDRGCLHQLRKPAARRYGRNLSRVAAADARLLLYMKAFRRGAPVGDEAERRRVVRKVEGALSPSFRIERVADTFLDRYRGRDPERALPGLVFWLARPGRD